MNGLRKYEMASMLRKTLLIKHQGEKEYEISKWGLPTVWRLLVLGFFVAYLCGLSACHQDPNKPLTFSERKQIDSLIVAHQKDWRAYYDSVCLLKQDSMVLYYFDSLLQEEIDAIKLLEK